MKLLHDITNSPILIVSSNRRDRQFTIRTTGATYKTIPLPKNEFERAKFWTGTDWMYFLKTDEYYKVSSKSIEK
jgi:hypothetical protein